MQHTAVLVPLLATAGLAAQQFRFSLQLDPANSGYGVQVVAGGDFNGDGVKDLIALEQGNWNLPGNGPLMVVRLCSGADGHQLAGYQYVGPVGSRLRCVAPLGDFDSDGRPDVVVAHDYGVDIRSGANLQWLQSVSIVGGSRYVANVGDLNADGIDDIGAQASSNFQAFSGATGLPLWTSPVSTASIPRRVGDASGDSVSDVFVGGNGAYYMLSGANGQVLWSFPANGLTRSAALGDANLDGVPDVAVSTIQTGGSGNLGRVEVISGSTGQAIYSVTQQTPNGDFGALLASARIVASGGRAVLLAGTSSTLYGFDEQGAEMFSQAFNACASLVGGFDLNGDGVAEYGIHNSGQWSDTFDIYTLIRADYATFGVGCPGAQGVPLLQSMAPPRLGQPFSLQVSNLTPFQLGFVFTGFSDQLWSGTSVPLPLPLGVIGMPACSVLVSPDVSNVTWSAYGVANWGFTIPAAPSFFGFEFFNQALFFDPVAPGGMLTTNGGRATIGY